MKKKARKPRCLSMLGGYISREGCVYLNGCRVSLGEARRLAAWLLKAADYLESRKKK